MKICKKIIEERGDLVEFLKGNELKNKKFGQIYFVTFKDKFTVRGQHYHKEITEWFGIITGKIEAVLYNLKTRKVNFYILDAQNKKYLRLKVPPFVVHTFTSLEKNSSLLNYCDQIWKPKDRYVYKIA